LDFADWIKETFLSGRKDEKEIPQNRRFKHEIDKAKKRIFNI
jgi:hypothetical protein